MRQPSLLVLLFVISLPGCYAPAPADCTMPTLPGNTNFVDPGPYYSGTSHTVDCMTGNFPETSMPSQSITCTNGMWSNIPPSACTMGGTSTMPGGACMTPTFPGNMNVAYMGPYNSGGNWLVTCMSGTFPENGQSSQTIYCNNGIWSGIPPSACTMGGGTSTMPGGPCMTPTFPGNMNMAYMGPYNSGGSWYVTCMSGTFPENGQSSQLVYCNNAVWTGIPPSACTMGGPSTMAGGTCALITWPANTNLPYSPPFNNGGSFQLSCTTGTFSDMSTFVWITCNSGIWTGVPNIGCDYYGQCTTPTYPPNTYLPYSPPYTTGSSYQLTCTAGTFPNLSSYVWIVCNSSIWMQMPANGCDTVTTTTPMTTTSITTTPMTTTPTTTNPTTTAAITTTEAAITIAATANTVAVTNNEAAATTIAAAVTTNAAAATTIAAAVTTNAAAATTIAAAVTANAAAATTIAAAVTTNAAAVTNIATIPTTTTAAAAHTTNVQAITTAGAATTASKSATVVTTTQILQATTTPDVIATCIAVNQGTKVGFNDSVSIFTYIKGQMAILQKGPLTQPTRNAIELVVTTLLKCLLQKLPNQLNVTDYNTINATLITVTTTCTLFDTNTWTNVVDIFDMGKDPTSVGLQGIRKSLCQISAQNLFGYCAPSSVTAIQRLDRIHEVTGDLLKYLPPGGSMTLKTADVQIDVLAPGAAEVNSIGGTTISLPSIAGTALWVKASTANPFPNAANVNGMAGPVIAYGTVGPYGNTCEQPFVMKVPITPSFAQVNTSAAQNQTNTTGDTKLLINEYSGLKKGTPFFFSVNPSPSNAKYTVLIWYKSKPADSKADMTVSLPTTDPAGPYTIKVKSDLLITGSSVYVSVKKEALTAKARRKRVADDSDLDLSAVQLGCKYYNDTLGDFQDDSSICQVDDASTPSNVVFKSNYFGSFSASVFTPPNSIDFSTVFGRFSELSSNYSVLATLCALAVLYLALLPVMIHLDRKDGRQWSFLPVLQCDPGGQCHYEISVFTSVGWNNGTNSPVSFELRGDRGCSITRLLDDGIHKGFPSGSQRNFLLSLHRPIGTMSAINIILHTDKNLKDATWSLRNIAVHDCATGKRFDFHNSRPLCTRKNAEVRLTPTQFQTYAAMQADVLGKSKNDLCEEHLWLSVLTRPTQTPFGRAERLTCCISILLLSMLTNMMFYNTDNNVKGNHAVEIGPFSFTIHGVYVSVISTLIVLPVNMAAMVIFKKTSPLRSPKEKKYSVTELEDEQKPRQLPRGLRVLAWILLFLAVVASLFFMLLYSIEFGDDKSKQWLASVFLSLFQDIFVMNPMKVIVLVTAFSFCFVSKTVRQHECSSMKEYQQAKHYKLQDHKLSLKLRTAMARVFCIFIIAFLCTNQRDVTTFLQNHSANQQFTFYAKQFNQIKDVSDMWNWTKTRLVPSLFPTDGTIKDVSDTYFYRLGAVRLRQVTVNTTKCVIPARWKKWLALRPCYPFYEPQFSSDTDLTAMLAKLNASNPHQSYSISGRFATYPMAGPYVDLRGSAASLSYINALEASSFIGRHTRAIIIEWNYYNPNTNLFTLMRVLFEIPPVGGVVASKFVRTVRLYTYTEDTGLLYMILQGLFCLSVLGNIVSLLYQTSQQGVAFFKQFWTILQGLYILVSLAAIGTFVYRTAEIISTVETVMNNRDAYVSLDTVADADDSFSLLLATIQLITVLSMMQLLDFNRYVALFSATLGETSRVLITYATLFGILIFSYTLFSTNVFASSMEEFHDFYSSVSTLFSMTLGSTLYSQLVQVNRILGQFFYITFMLLVFLVMTNLFVTLINSNYDHVKRMPLSEWFDQDLVEHLVKKFSATLRIETKDGKKKVPAEGSEEKMIQLDKHDAHHKVQRRLDELYFRVDKLY